MSVAVDGTVRDPWVAQGRAVIHEDLSHRSRLLRSFADTYGGWDVADASVDGRRALVEIGVDRWLMRPDPADR